MRVIAAKIVVSAMVSSAYDLQILDSVVVSNTIEMVNLFLRKEITS